MMLYHQPKDKSPQVPAAGDNGKETEEKRWSFSDSQASSSSADAVSQVSTSRMTCYGRSCQANYSNSASCSCQADRELQISQKQTHWKKLRRKRPMNPRRFRLEMSPFSDSGIIQLVPEIRTSRTNLLHRIESYATLLSFEELFRLAKSLLDLCGNGVLLLLAVIAPLCNSVLGGSGSFLSPRLLLCRFVVLLSPWLLQLSDACSTRPSPKPRPPRPYWRVDETLPKFNCTKDYEELYCLNNGSCFMQMNIHDVPTPYCVCYGYYGRRCEYLDIEDRHLPTVQRQRIETAAISVAVTLLIMIAFLLSVAIYVYRRRMKYPRTVYDTPDGVPDRPFSIRRRGDQMALRRPRRPPEEGDVSPGFDPRGAAGFEYIDEERKASYSVPERAEVHAARSSVV